MSVSLSPQAEARVRLRLEGGSYQSVDEVIDDALDLLEERDRRLDALRAKLRIGLESGEGIEYSRELMDEIEREAEEAYRRGEKPSPDVLP
jgi:putative addiction module CopG family antidote